MYTYIPAHNTWYTRTQPGLSMRASPPTTSRHSPNTSPERACCIDTCNTSAAVSGVMVSILLLACFDCWCWLIYLVFGFMYRDTPEGSLCRLRVCLSSFIACKYECNMHFPTSNIPYISISLYIYTYSQIFQILPCVQVCLHETAKGQGRVSRRSRGTTHCQRWYGRGDSSRGRIVDTRVNVCIPCYSNRLRCRCLFEILK